jgi:branched-chain amino acid transport system ATP-binding protein
MSDADAVQDDPEGVVDPDADAEDLSEVENSAPEEAAREVPPGLPLRVEGLVKRFGGITAVDGATFEVEEGSLTGLIGPNGAGKSTTFNCITGVHGPTDGTIYFKGEDITGLEPYEIAQRGLVRTFQIARELEDMTVLENLMLAPKNQGGESVFRSVMPGLRGGVVPEEEEIPERVWEMLEFFEIDHLAGEYGGVVSEEEEIRERVWEMLEFFEIDHLAGEYAGGLSGGQRKLLEMARALMADPDVVLLDEPLAGVNPTLEEKLLDRIHELREEGYTFLLVEHDMDVIMNNCERIIVMHQGQVLADGTSEDIQNNEQVIKAYLGEDI